MIVALLVFVAMLVGLRWLRRDFVVAVVRGDSMAPTYRDGQRVLTRRFTGPVRTGDVVVFRVAPAANPVPGDPPWRIKRIAAVAGEPVPPWLGEHGRVPPGHLVVSGDNPRSQDSRQLGFVAMSTVVGVVRTRRMAEPSSR